MAKRMMTTTTATARKAPPRPPTTFPATPLLGGLLGSVEVELAALLELVKLARREVPVDSDVVIEVEGTVGRLVLRRQLAIRQRSVR